MPLRHFTLGQCRDLDVSCPPQVIPYTGPIPGGLHPGEIIVIQGSVPPDADRWAEASPSQGDLIKHTNLVSLTEIYQNGSIWNQSISVKLVTCKHFSWHTNCWSLFQLQCWKSTYFYWTYKMLIVEKYVKYMILNGTWWHHVCFHFFFLNLFENNNWLTCSITVLSVCAFPVWSVL